MTNPQQAGRPDGKSKSVMRAPGGSAKPNQKQLGPSARPQPKPRDQGNDSDKDDSDSSASGSDDSEPDTEDEIRAANAAPKSKKTQKRKRRAVSPSAFGAALTNLLGPSAAASAALAPKETEGSSDISSDEEAEESEEGEDEAEGKEEEGDENREQEAEAEESDEEEPTKPAKRARVSPSEAAKPAPASAPAPGNQGPILALAPHIKRADAKASLASKAERQLIAERKRAFELTHVKDVISSWGPPGQVVNYDGSLVPALGQAPIDDDSQAAWDDQGGSGGYEKRLRKVAQRGVVKLFNVIRDTQRKASEPDEAEETSGLVRSIQGKPPLPPGTKKGLESKDSFLDLIKTGGKR